MSEEKSHVHHAAAHPGHYPALRAGQGGVEVTAGRPPGAAIRNGGEPRNPVEAGPRPHAMTRRLSVVVTSVASDAHTWNLVFLQLALEELGHQVLNLGACVPDELLINECLRVRPDLVVVSTVNGHGYLDGMRLIGQFRAHPELADTPVVIGGKLGIAGPGRQAGRDQLRAAGFDAIFEDGAGLVAFRSFTKQLTMSVST